ncbi:MAG: hypothetical protein EBS68_10120 [Rhodobacteraceae bacterium]|jgi:hypothetical protein|nr:hypothetical protein [Paracoccaceae bacterium]
MKQDLTVHEAEVVAHRYDASRKTHNIKVRLDFSFPEDRRPLSWEVSVALQLRPTTQRRRLMQIAERRARSFLHRYFAAEDAAGDNLFA